MCIALQMNTLTTDIYFNLHQQCGFKEYHKEDIDIAIKNHLFDAVLFDENKPIGMIRVVGDNRLVFFIKDVMLLPEYCGRGYGKVLMDSALSYIKRVGCKDAYIGLMSTVSYEPFYEKFGFIRRPNKEYGSGMVKFND